MKELVYNGFKKDIFLKPILNEPSQINTFKEIEISVLKSILSNGQIISGSLYDKTQFLAQSHRKKNVLAIPYRITINYTLFKEYIIKNIK